MASIRHLAIRCHDMEKSRDFYESAFGWKFIGYRPSGQGLDLTDGEINITLIQQPDDCERPTLEEGNEYIHFGVIVNNLEASWHRFKEWGAEFSKDNIKQRNEIDEHKTPERSFKVLDPDGNVIDITATQNEWRGVRVTP